MQSVIRPILYDFGKSAVGVLVASRANLADRLDFGDSFVLESLSNGAVNFAVSDVIDLASQAPEGSRFASMDLIGILDGVAFFSVLAGASSMIQGADQVENLFKSVTADKRTVAIAVDATFLTLGRQLASYIDNTPQAPNFLQVIRHPSRLFSQAN